MLKHISELIILALLLVVVCVQVAKSTEEEERKSISSTEVPTSQDTAAKIPAVIKSPSSAGEVTFPHQQHIEDFEIECQDCHHETNAARLHMPHEDYFKDFWIDCNICHHETGTAKLTPQACSKCHHASPATITDETLSAKVVIHNKCWECHEAEKGAEASQNCIFCHTGPRIEF